MPARRSAMDEHVHCQYLREEEFLEVHYETVDALLERLGPDWKPNYQCDDQVRAWRAQLLARSRLQNLAFDAGVVFHGRDGLSSIRVYLRSSSRFLVARIHWVGAEAQVEILADS